MSILLSAVYSTAGWAETFGLVPAEVKQSKPFYYQIEKDGKISHILGSMHAGIPLSSFPEEIFTAAAQAKNVAFEADVESFKANYMDQIKAAALYPNGETLQQNISAQSAAKLKEMYGADALDKLNKYKPWAVANEMNQTVLEALKKKLDP